MYKQLKKKVHHILEPGDKAPFASQIFVIFIMALIVLNVIAIILDTVEGYHSAYGRFFRVFNFFSVMVFTVEYLLRLWSCTENRKYHSPIWGRLLFIVTPLALIDLIAILPFYIPMVTNVDLRFLRALRLFRIFKMTRYSSRFKVFMDVLRDKKEEILISLMLVVVLLIISASLMYYAENKVQPEEFSNIPEAMWWAVVTLTTVGYGEVVPATSFGRVLAGCVAVLGISLFAIPAGIIASGFIEQFQKRHKKKADYCPHCGKHIE